MTAQHAATGWRSVLPWRRPLSPAVAGVFALLRLFPTVSRSRTLLLAASIIVSTIVPLAITVVTGLLVGSIPAAVEDGLSSAAGNRAITLVAAAAVLIVAVRVVGPFQSALASAFARQVDRRLQERVMAAVSGPSGIGHLEDPAILDLMKNAQEVGTGGLRPSDAVRALASLLPNWLQALGSALILLGFHWWLGLLWVALWPVGLYVLQREFLRIGNVAMGQAAAVRRSDYYRELAIRPGAAKELRLWGLLDWLIVRFDAAWQQAMLPVWQARRPGRPILWVVSGAVTLVNLGAFGLLAWAAINGEISLAALAVFTNALLNANSFRAFDDANSQLAYAAVALPSLLDLEQRLAAPDQLERRHAPTHTLSADSPRREIGLEHVTFRYPGRTADVLSDLDLVIAAGRSLAIVGSNGAGKTTLVKLLGRLYTVTSGRILADGIDLRDVDTGNWQRRVAAVYQDFAQYHLSARDNVGLGAPALAGDHDRLCIAARKAGALELIESLPRGWDTVLSRQYTGGVDLSGGQWQRIALARALFAVEGGARVLILDEPTASLDVRAEAELYDRFLEITAGLTTILISHRFSTVRRAHRICVLKGGRVVEQGAHDELVAEGGRYATMFALQAARFADEARGR